MAAVDNRKPPRSIRGARGSREVGVDTAMRTAAAPATGAMAKKMLVQSKASTSQPPTIGPRAIAAPVIAPHEEAPPPVATTLFALTARGEQLRPVMEALVRWGAPLMRAPDPHDEMRSHWLAYALDLMLSDGHPEGAPVTVEVRTADQPIVIEARDGAVRTRLGTVTNPDGVLTGPPELVLGVLLGGLDLADVPRAELSCAGDARALDRLCRRPTPASPV